MFLRLTFFFLVVYGAYVCLPILHCYLPNTTTAMENLFISIKNDSLNIMHNHKILPSIRKAMDMLDKKIGEFHHQLESDSTLHDNLNN